MKKLVNVLLSVGAYMFLVLPVYADEVQVRSNQFWWPNLVDLSSLRDHDARSNPHGADFDYAAEFQQLDLDEVKADICLLYTSPSPRDREKSRMPSSA